VRSTKAPTCIHCRTALAEGKTITGGYHAPTMAKCDWHPKHREESEPHSVEACRSLFVELLSSTVRGARGRGDEARECRVWILSRSKEPGSFLWCCDLFTVDPDVVLENERKAWAA
jgi:hypothetical protein